MAVRRQLRKVLQDPELTGVITVERSLPPAARVSVERSLPPAARVSVERSLLPAARVSVERSLLPATSVSVERSLLPATSVSVERSLPPAAPVTVERSLPPAAPVTVERSLPPAAATWVLQPTTSTLLSSRPSSPPRRQGPLPEDCAVFHCRGCWTVLGDSLYLCSQDRRLGVLVCFKVTNDVAWKDSLMIGLEGALLGCAYHALTCRSCGFVVGFILYSTAAKLACLRGLFCFFMDSIFCYLLKNKMIIEANNVNFPAVTLKEKLQELKDKIVEVHFRLESLMKQLEELEQKKNEAERQSSASDPVTLPSRYARFRVN